MIRINNIKTGRGKTHETDLRRAVSKHLRIPEQDILQLEIVKESVDARKRPAIFHVYTLDVAVRGEERLWKKNRKLVRAPEKPEPPHIIPWEKPTRPVIVGSGPSGLFCAHLLAKAGARPIIVEQGEDVDARNRTIRRFFEDGVLNPHSNVQFGEGGAGTFSDGKMNSSVKDPLNRYVLETFVRHGAQNEILRTNKPHVGTDRLVEVLRSFRKEIEADGGEFRFGTRWVGLERAAKGWRLVLETSEGQDELVTDCLIPAVGNAARETYRFLNRAGVPMEAKPFAVGFRIQHPQAWINEACYGEPEPEDLPTADYKLTWQSSSGKPVFSFCMCPGGYVVNASSEPGGTVVNGMSYSGRNSGNANSAIVVGVDFTDGDLFDGMHFQERLETEAFRRGGGRIPTTTLGAFRDCVIPTEPGIVEPKFKGEWVFADLRGILPRESEDAILEALEAFERRIPGFNHPDALLSAVESRTSCPIRMPRGDGRESDLAGIWPVGEGAGYAGGIMSAAIDGLKTAAAVLKSGNEERKDDL